MKKITYIVLLVFVLVVVAGMVVAIGSLPISCDKLHPCSGGKICSNGICTDQPVAIPSVVAPIPCDKLHPCSGGKVCLNNVCVAGPCTPVAATPCSAGVGCPGNTVIPALGCFQGLQCQNGVCARPPPVAIEGDVNRDGCVNLADIFLIGTRVAQHDPVYTPEKLKVITHNVNLWCVHR